MTHQLSRADQETIIRFDEEDPTAYVYTASTRVRDAMVKAGLKPAKAESDGWFFEVPKRAVQLKAPGVRRVYLGPQTSTLRPGARQALPSSEAPEPKQGPR